MGFPHSACREMGRNEWPPTAVTHTYSNRGIGRQQDGRVIAAASFNALGFRRLYLALAGELGL